MPLTDRQLDELTEPLEALYERFYQSVIEDMARRLARIDMSSTTAYQAARLHESGLLYDQLLERLSKLTGLTERELRRAFRKYGAKFTERDEKIYRKAGLVPAPLGQSTAMMNALAAGLHKTGMVAKNLTMTTALTTQQAFIDTADLAYMQVSTGAMSYQAAIREAVLSCAKRGLTVINFASGRQDQLDVAMRRTVLTGVSQTTGVMQMTLAEEMGCDLVEVDAHYGARNHGTGPMNHESWQGKIYSISGRDRRYPPLVETTGYGTVIGLYGANCRHSMYPFFEGISEPSYSKGELREMAERKVTYNGEELTYYDATQKQRAIERAIRKSKREAGALEAAGLDNTAERVRLGLHQAKMRDFIEQTGLVRDRFREQVPGVNVRAITKKIKASEPIQSIDMTDNPYSQERKDKAYRFTDEWEADGIMRPPTGRHWLKLYRTQHIALHEYTAGSGKFNRPLRGFDSHANNFAFKGVGNIPLNNEGAEHWINGMTNAINGMSYDFDMYLTRGVEYNGAAGFFGIDESYFKSYDVNEVRKFILGNKYIDEGFFSCGTAAGKQFNYDVQYTIYAPKGTKMIYAEPFSRYGYLGARGKDWDGFSVPSYIGSEQETIIQRGTKYKVTSVDYNKSTKKWEIGLDVVGVK